jgi:hypothetical protein
MANKKHIIYHDIEQGSEEWNKGRHGNFTGSNAYKLLSTFGAGSHAMSVESFFGGNFHTERGHILEDEAIELYNEIYGVSVQFTGFVTNNKYPNCLYSPDGYLDDKIIEVKCFSPKKHLELIKNPKLEVLAQCHFGQLILEKNLTHLVAYCPKPKNWNDEQDGEWLVPLDKMFVVIPIKRDKDIQNNFKRIIKEYHDKQKK